MQISNVKLTSHLVSITQMTCYFYIRYLHKRFVFHVVEFTQNENESFGEYDLVLANHCLLPYCLRSEFCAVSV